MSKNYFKECWSCGSSNLEPYLTGVKCRDCGATHNELPKLGPEILERGLGGGTLITDGRGSKKGRPSKAAQRKAALIRREKAV